MKNTRKIISAVLAVLMIMSVISGLNLQSFAAAEEYGLWIEGSRVTSDTCRNIPVTGGSAAFDPDTNTLTLDSATLSGNSGEALVFAEGIDLTINLLGSSRLVFSDKNGIEVKESLRVTSSSGSGTITLEMNKGENAGSSNKLCKAIDGGKSFTLNSGTLQVTGNLYNRDGYILSRKDTALTAESCNFIGGRAVFNMNITENDQFIYDRRIDFMCIYANDILISDSAQIEVDCKDSSNSNIEKNFYGIYSDNSFTMTGGKISAVIEGKDDDYAIYAANTTQISGGEIYVDSGNGSMGFSGEQIQISGGTFEGYGVRSGLFARDSISITGGTIKTIATGETGRGLLANKGISITGVTGSIYAKGGEYAMLNLYNGITIKDNAVITSPERGTIGASKYGYPVIADQNGDPVKEATILPAVSCSVSRNGGEETPVVFSFNGTNEFEVPVGETCSVKLVSNIPDKKLQIADLNGPLPRASIFLRTSSRAIIATFDFAPTYRPTGTSSNGEYSVENDSITHRIRYLGESYSIPPFGAIRFTVVKGDLTGAFEDITAEKGSAPQTVVSTLKNSQGVILDPDSTDFPDITGVEVIQSGSVVSVDWDAKQLSISFNDAGTAQIKVTYAGNDSYNAIETSFTVTVTDDYQLLDDKNSFEEYKDELKKAAEEMRKDDDSAESKKLIDDTVAAIEALEYDETKSLDDNKKAVEDAAALDELTEQLEEHRAVYYAVFKADGVEIASVPYTIDTVSIEEPAVPVKDNYTGAWPQYELTAGGVEINAVYVKNGALVITDNAKEQGADRVLTFMETVTFTTNVSGLPEGAVLQWYVNGEAVSTDTSVTVESPKDDYTVQVKAFAKDGTLYTESEVLTVKVDNSLWAKIVAGAKLSFTPVFNAMKKVVPSFFSFLIALIKAIATALVAVVKSVI